MSNQSKPCGTCGLMNVGSNGVAVTDMKKHLTSPIPCPECMQEAKEHFAELGRQVAQKVEEAVWGSITSKPSKRTLDPNDITIRLRRTRADMIGTTDEEHYWDCHDAAAEIERLRIVIDTYAGVCEASEREIKAMKDRLSSGRIVHVSHTAED